MAKLNMIVACNEEWGIGYKNRMPWHLPSDLKYFRKITTNSEENKQNVVIMGRKTWESIPAKYKPLPNRINIILSRSQTSIEAKNTFIFSSLDDALDFANSLPIADKIFIIGGGELYRQAINLVDAVYLTEVKNKVECDTFFPNIYELGFKIVNASPYQIENNIEFRFIYSIRDGIPRRDL